jgi:hypothetical protein
MPQLDSEAHRQQERRSLYLRKMKGLCFNCLGRNHKIASCCDPTRCWRCRPSSFMQPPNNRLCLNLRDVLAPPRNARDVGAMVDDSLLFGYSTSSTTYERRFNPMLLKALLMNQRRGIEGGSSTPPSTDLTLQVTRHHTSTGDILT